MPIILLMIFGIIDFGRVMITYAMASNSVRDAVRRAETIGYAFDVDDIPPFADCDGMRNTAARTFFVDTGDITIWYRQVHLDADLDTEEWVECTGSTFDPDALANGDLVRVDVNRTIYLMTPIVSSLVPSLSIQFTGQRTVIKEIPLHGITDEDNEDRDTDYDGLRDLWEEEHFGNGDGTVSADEQAQTGTDDPDGDGCANGCEESRGTDPNNPDTDGDTLNDGDESYRFITSPLKPDTDDDGLLDPDELLLLSDPWVPDTDGDTLLDGAEVNTYGTSPIKMDTDDDGLRDDAEIGTYSTDPLTPYSDEDSLTDYEEIITYGTNPNNPDTDGDGLDDDDEIEGYDAIANLTIVHYTTDPTVADEDGDGLDDSQERDGWASTVDGAATQFYPDPHTADSDGDGLDDSAERAAGTNPVHEDTDRDGLTDAYELANPPQNPLQADAGDVDEDNLPDSWEESYFGAAFIQPGYAAGSDPDGDGCDNMCEFQNGLNPINNDTDTDGLADGQEVASTDSNADGISDSYSRPYGTNPKNPDTDLDGLGDGQEVSLGTSPTDTDSDDDTRTDGQEVSGYDSQVSINGSTQTQRYTSNPLAANSDADSFDDAQEYNRGTNPRSVDTDGDGLNDDAEVNTNSTNPMDDDSDDDGMKDGFEVTGYTAGGAFCQSNPANPDTDGDYRSDSSEYNTGRNPCVVEPPKISVGDVTVKEGDYITLNGSTGEVILGQVDLIQPEMSGSFKTLMGWADAARKLNVRANADTPHDARVAREFGAEGIGLCRTEHMFFEGDRIKAVREMILADTLEGRKRALAKLLPMQKGDFIGIFREMKGLPVTIRLLDPPLHEFLPQTEEDLLLLFRQSHNRHFAVQLEFLQDIDSSAQLAFTSVDNDQVWQEGERRVWLGAGRAQRRRSVHLLSAAPPAESARQHLLHRGEIIRCADHALDIELSVQFFVGHALCKYHHGADNGRSLGVRNVITFDAVGRCG